EGIRMVAEGVEPALVENAARLLGFPVGPLQLVDETSIDLGVKIAKATRAAMGAAYPDQAVDAVLFAMADKGRLGRKANAGSYAYDEKGGRTGLWEGLAGLWPVAAAQPDLAEVQHRLMLVQVLEAVRALEEGVLTDIREGDVGAILGWGFAPWSGGPFSWLDMIGAGKAVEVCEDLAGKGARFAAPELLRDMATKGQSFYGRIGTDARAACRRHRRGPRAPARRRGVRATTTPSRDRNGSRSGRCPRHRSRRRSRRRRPCSRGASRARVRTHWPRARPAGESRDALRAAPRPRPGVRA